MTPLLIHSTLLAGLGLFAVACGIRFMSKEVQLRSDLTGAAVFLGSFVVLRVVWNVLRDVLPDGWINVTRLLWMLAFAFGVVRLLVAVGLYLWRRVQRGPTTKIHRDVIDFALYLLTAIPILKITLAIDVTTLLGTSAVLSLVLGFALQDTLSNLFSGLSVQLERPFSVGDWITVGTHTGKVVQIAWRSTRIENLKRELITLPNSLIAKEAVKTLSRNGLTASIDVNVGVEYGAPPNRVRAEILAACDEAPSVAKEPKPVCVLASYDDSEVRYLIRFATKDFSQVGRAQDEVLTRLWYRFGRAGIELPFPQRVVTIRDGDDGPKTEPGLLDKLDLFKPFTPEERLSLGESARHLAFGVGEQIIVVGAEGQSFFVVAKGRVSVRAKGSSQTIAELGPGAYFGEMSLMTGEPRSATVVAVQDSVVLEFDRDDFATRIQQNPQLAQQLAEVLASRRSQLVEAQSNHASTEEGTKRILERLKQIFRL